MEVEGVGRRVLEEARTIDRASYRWELIDLNALVANTTGGAMRAIRPKAPGTADVLTLTDVELPPPGPGQAQVAVTFAGVNFIDVYHRTGQYPLPAPLPLGREGAGVVTAVGPGVALAVGARVAWCDVGGSYAEAIVAPADKLVPVPDGVGLDVAAAVMLQGLTAHYLATSTYALTTGSRCLIHAAAGGVGLLLCQLARAAGADVLGTVSSDASKVVLPTES